MLYCMMCYPVILDPFPAIPSQEPPTHANKMQIQLVIDQLKEGGQLAF